MNTPNLHKTDDFDETIGRQLKYWGEQKKPSKAIRGQLLIRAADENRKQWKQEESLPARLRKWLAVSAVKRRTDLHYTEFSGWLYSQAMLQNLNMDRRAVRFVC
jgi:hypothetical protein